MSLLITRCVKYVCREAINVIHNAGHTIVNQYNFMSKYGYSLTIQGALSWACNNNKIELLEELWPPYTTMSADETLKHASLCVACLKIACDQRNKLLINTILTKVCSLDNNNTTGNFRIMDNAYFMACKFQLIHVTEVLLQRLISMYPLLVDEIIQIGIKIVEFDAFICEILRSEHYFINYELIMMFLKYVKNNPSLRHLRKKDVQALLNMGCNIISDNQETKTYYSELARVRNANMLTIKIRVDIATLRVNDWDNNVSWIIADYAAEY